MQEHPVYDHTSSLNADGSRQKIHPADVQGVFASAKKWVYPVLMVWMFLAPSIDVGGKPLLFLDIAARKFYFLGLTFNAQDVYLIFFLITGLAFGLFYLTAIMGRVFCGWACPQTVFLEGIYRQIERWIEGPRQRRMKLAKKPWTLAKGSRFVFKHVIFVLVSVALAIAVLRYFAPMEHILAVFKAGPQSHPMIFGWGLFLTALLYGNFSWFREQTCLILCPYGRLQSVLIDDDSLVIGYDENRGEPRGKPSESGVGDCVDCNRCVVVCPTGIDIRKGLQMECIGCANCIDACDDIMERLGRPKGLVRYDSLNGLEGRKRQFLRPRFYLYTALMIFGGVMAGAFLINRPVIEANVLRLTGAPYVLEGNTIRNRFEIHVFNKTAKTDRFTIEIDPPKGVKAVLPMRSFDMPSLTDRRVPLFVEVPKAQFKGDFTLDVKVKNDAGEVLISKVLTVLGPG